MMMMMHQQQQQPQPPLQQQQHMSHTFFGDHGMGAASTSAASPSGSDFLNPNNPISASPSPLRTTFPFSASPDHSNTASPIGIKGENGFSNSGDSSILRSHTVPSQPITNMAMPGPSTHSTPIRANSTGGPGTLPSSGPGSGGDNTASTKFVHKLFRMVCDPEYQHLISWNANGTSVVVTNFDEFSKEVLGKHFKHSNFSSFIRQLNMYGFYKVNKTPRGHRHTVDTQVWEFSHPKFIRGRPDLLDEIRRKALDSEHARVEARDLQYSVSVGHMQLRQQVDEQQYRLEEMTEMNLALRGMVLGLRDSLSNVLDWIKMTNGGQLPFDARLPMVDLPPTPMLHPFMAERPPAPWAQSPNPNMAAMSATMGTPSMLSQADMMGDGPSIFVTEPGFAMAPPDVFSMGAMGQVSPMASRRVSVGSHTSERPDMNNMGQRANAPPRMSIDTSLAAAHLGANPGLGVMGLASPMNGGDVQIAINTPLPPSPAVPQAPQMGMMPPGSGANTPFAVDNGFFSTSPAMANFPNAGFFGNAANPSGMAAAPLSPNMVNGIAFNGMQQQGSALLDEDGTALGPNAKAMRTQMKRTASNSGSQQMMAAAAAAAAAAATGGVPVQQQKRKSPAL